MNEDLEVNAANIEWRLDFIKNKSSSTQVKSFMQMQTNTAHCKHARKKML